MGQNQVNGVFRLQPQRALLTAWLFSVTHLQVDMPFICRQPQEIRSLTGTVENMRTRVYDLRTSGSRTTLSKSIGLLNVGDSAQQNLPNRRHDNHKEQSLTVACSPATLSQKPAKIAAGRASRAFQPRYQSQVSPDERKHEARHNRETGFVTFKCFHLF